jgi:hypothetical protein
VLGLPALSYFAEQRKLIMVDMALNLKKLNQIPASSSAFSFPNISLCAGPIIISFEKNAHGAKK